MALTVFINAGPWLTVPPQGYGGIENVIATLIPELRRNDVRVVLATVGASTITVDEMISAFEEPQFPRLGEPYNEVMGVPAAHMVRVINEVRSRSDVDLIHDHVEALGLTMLVAAEACLPPVLHTLHWDVTKHPALYSSFRSADRVWVNGVSDNQMSRAPTVLRKHSLGHVHLATPLAGTTMTPLRTKKDHLVFVARICARKGQHVAARIAQRLGRPLVLAGPVGPYTDAGRLAADPHADRYADVRYWRDEVAPLVDGDLVRWVGNVTGDDRDRLVGTARATLFPLLWDEPGGTGVVESLALGTPVVGYARGCLPELVEPGTGLLAPPGDEAELARLVEEAAHIDPAVCRAVAERRFSPKVMCAAYLTLYEKCLARASHA
jgi:glycosyltransferase involved in cell wall biosynthesis